jgi:simple sugar transport system ATP-binding protein
VPDPVLEMHGIQKSYGAARVLHDVDLVLGPGEVRCLAGENGSGKSTLIKILSGVVGADAGTVKLFGQTMAATHPSAVIAAGLSVIYQDFALFPNLTAGENITFLRAAAHRHRVVHWRQRRQIAAATLKRMGVALDLDEPVETLPVASKQLVAIARALANDARIIVMDEPTTALTRKEVDNLLRLVAALKQQGVSFIFVSHKIEEVFTVCDTVTVIRDGRVAAAGPAADFTPAALVVAMTGRDIASQRLARAGAAPAKPFLAVRGLTRFGEYQDIDLDLHAGEIVCIVGLLGSGRTELALTLFGETGPDSGSITIEGRPAGFKGVRDAMAAGIAYVPEDRLSEGLFLDQSIRDNIVVSSLDRDKHMGLLDVAALGRRAKAAVERLRIRLQSIAAPVMQLSGGNQQRVVLARWMERDPRLIILNSPTVGVDVGSKRDIHELVVALRAKSTAVLVVTDDIGEALAIGDRIIVMAAGRLITSFAGEEASEAEIAEEVSKDAA